MSTIHPLPPHNIIHSCSTRSHPCPLTHRKSPTSTWTTWTSSWRPSWTRKHTNCSRGSYGTGRSWRTRISAGVTRWVEEGRRDERGGAGRKEGLSYFSHEGFRDFVCIGCLATFFVTSISPQSSICLRNTYQDRLKEQGVRAIALLYRLRFDGVYPVLIITFKMKYNPIHNRNNFLNITKHWHLLEEITSNVAIRSLIQWRW